MTVWSNPRERVRFAKFMVVGAIGAAVDFGIMNLLTRLCAAPLVVAGTISFACAVVSNFLWNRYWTYPDSRSRPALRQLGMFVVVNVAGVGLRIPILHWLEAPAWHLFQRLAPSLSPSYLAKNFTLAIAIGVVMLWNFFVNRYWTYNDVEE